MSEDSPMDDEFRKRWRGLNERTVESLDTRNYEKAELATRLGTVGVEAGEIATDSPGPKEGLEDVWIPGVEIFPRRVFQQRHRGWFAEFSRMTEGRLHDIGLNPQQWATATMFANTAKGFHIHPPAIPEDEDPATWNQNLYPTASGATDYDARPYGEEQWDAMFFVQGMVEFLLVDERAGMQRKVMRFLIDGDNFPGSNNIGLVIPAGVAHALRSASSENVIMVYGTSTTFHPPFEGRLFSSIEECPLPPEWKEYLEE
ncbi:MAG: hypothetical protein HKN23_21410 [Verrucomicrobiales bacterium]|nr:hypothetical protein [Verrucomicrobiales bacterium]